MAVVSLFNPFPCNCEILFMSNATQRHLGCNRNSLPTLHSVVIIPSSGPGRHVVAGSMRFPMAVQNRGVRSVLRIRAAGGGVETGLVEEEKPKEPSEVEKVKKAKKAMLDLFYGTDRGLSATSKTRAEIVKLCNELEALNPTRTPSEAFSRVNGKWILAYISFSGFYPLLSRVVTIPWVKVEEISQTIDSKKLIVQNSVQFSGPFATTSFISNAKFEIHRPELGPVEIKFKEGLIGTPQLGDSIELSLSPFKGLMSSLQGTATSVVKTISSHSPLNIPITNTDAQSWLLAIYLDDELLISRGDGGSVFVHIKEGSSLLT